MPSVEEAVSELAKVFSLIEEEYRESGQALPRDTTEIVHAWRTRIGTPASCDQTWREGNQPEVINGGATTTATMCIHTGTSLVF